MGILLRQSQLLLCVADRKFKRCVAEDDWWALKGEDGYEIENEYWSHAMSQIASRGSGML